MSFEDLCEAAAHAAEDKRENDFFNSKFAQPLKMFVVAIMDNHREYTFYMSSGINEDRRGKFSYTQDRTRAQKFAKLTAESLVERLRKDYRRIARVEEEQ